MKSSECYEEYKILMEIKKYASSLKVEEFLNNWEVPIEESWHNRFF